MFELHIGIELPELLLLASVVGWVILMGWIALRAKGNKWLLLSFALLPAYLNWSLFMSEGAELSSQMVFNMWFRHAFFYAGQLCFFLFISRQLILPLNEPQKGRAKAVLAGVFIAYLLLGAMPHAVLAAEEFNFFELPPTPYNIVLFLTEQGVQHILAILFFFLTIAIIRTQALFPGMKEQKRLVTIFFAANACFILLHLWEYMGETLHWIPLDDEEMEMVEPLFQFTGYALFVVAVLRMTRVRVKERLGV